MWRPHSSRMSKNHRLLLFPMYSPFFPYVATPFLPYVQKSFCVCSSRCTRRESARRRARRTPRSRRPRGSSASTSSPTAPTGRTGARYARPASRTCRRVLLFFFFFFFRLFICFHFFIIIFVFAAGARLHGQGAHARRRGGHHWDAGHCLWGGGPVKINRNTCDGKRRERGATLSGDLARIFSDRIAHPRSSLGYLCAPRLQVKSVE